MKYRVARVDFFTGESTRIGDCYTIDEAMDLIREFMYYDFLYDYTINGHSDMEYFARGLAE